MGNRRHSTFDTDYPRVDDFEYRNEVFVHQVLRRFRDVAGEKGVLYGNAEGLEVYAADPGQSVFCQVKTGVAFILGERAEVLTEQNVALDDVETEDNIICIEHAQAADPDADATRLDAVGSPHTVWYVDSYALKAIPESEWANLSTQLALARVHWNPDTGEQEVEDLREYAQQQLPLADDTVPTDAIQDEAVTAPKIATSAVTSAKLHTASVTENKIGAGAVTENKIWDGAVTTGKIADEAVTTGKLDDDAVTTDKIADGAVDTAQIADDAVTADKIAAGAIGPEHIEAELLVCTIAAKTKIDPANGPLSTSYFDSPDTITHQTWLVAAAFDRTESIKKLRFIGGASTAAGGTTGKIRLRAMLRYGSTALVDGEWSAEFEYHVGSDIRDIPDTTAELDLSANTDYGRWVVWVEYEAVGGTHDGMFYEWSLVALS